MLKWLKQKPAHFEVASLTNNKAGNEQSFATTDDPLATFQVQLKLGKESPGKKKSKLFKSGSNNNKNEVYSVSRVNPLFDGSSNSLVTVGKNPAGDARGQVEGDHVANHSGSSGYDSNSNTNPSDNEESSEGDNHSQGHEDDGVSGTVFKDTDSDVVISRKIVTITPTETESEGPRDREHAPDESASVPTPPPLREPSSSTTAHRPPVVIHQNPGYVKSIILAMGGGKAFGGVPNRANEADNAPTAIGRPLSSPPPLFIPKNPNAGRPPPPPPAPPAPLSSIASTIPAHTLHPTNLPDASESVDDLGPVVKLVHKNSQYVQSIRICQHPQGPSSSSSSSGGSVNVGFGKPTRIKQTHPRNSSAESSTREIGGHKGARRKPSVTFSELVDVVVDGHPENGKRRKKSSAGDVQLEKFSSSLSKNRIVKQIISKSALPPAVPDNANLADDSADVEAESDFVYHHVSDNKIPGTESHYRSRGSQSIKSPFGGIADHYAAAKEIAKEIESYSTGTTKSTKISFVRDLLLSHGNRSKASSRRNRSPPPPIATTSSYLVTPHNLHSTKNDSPGSGSGRSPYAAFAGAGTGPDEERYPIIKVVDGKVSVVRQPSSSARWQVLQVQPQVYVKASDGDGEAATTKTNGSGPARSNNASEYDYANRGDEGQDQQQNQVPIYEALPSAHNSSPGNRNHDDSDSGHSTDRNASGSDTGGKVPSTSTRGQDDCSSSSSSGDQDHPASSSSSARAGGSGSSSSSVCSSSGESGKNKSKVMIISGDSQNMVVDLTAVPSELRTAIIAGTTLMQLPSTTDFRQHPHTQQLEPGYTLITLPPEIRGQLGSGGGGSDGDGDEERLQGKFSRHNLTQIWNVMQASLMGSGGNGGRKKKDVTTVLPFHPNRDAHTTPDFTLEGHRLALQAKRVRNGKRRRCLCRLCGMLVFLVSFLGVIVTLSLIYTNGRKYFGSA